MKDFDYSAIAQRLKARRTQLGYSYQELAQKTNMSKSTLQRYEVGSIKNIPIARLQALSNALEMEPNDLIGVDVSTTASSSALPSNILPMPKLKKTPRLGAIACGKPILAVENIECYDSIPEDIHCDFTLLCKGDSMINARIFDGDIVCVKQMDIVNSGEIAVALVDSEEATLKRVRLFDDHIVLEPENPMYKPLVFWHEDMNRVRILGKATHFISTIH